MTRVVVIDDDPAIQRALVIALRARGYDVRAFANGHAALRSIDGAKPDVVLLDLGLPDIDGLRFLQELRRHSGVPVIVISGRTGSKDKIEALDQGADDFIPKPFAIDQLIARVRAHGRPADHDDSPHSIDIDGLTLDLVNQTVTRDGSHIALTPSEWRLVSVLASRPGRLVRTRQLLNTISGAAQANTHELRAHIASIRRKLEPDAAHPTLILTEPGAGYRFAPVALERAPSEG